MNKKMNNSELEKVFQKNNWYLSSDKLKKLDINNYFIIKLVDTGKIIKIKDGLFRWKNADLDGRDDLLDIANIEPNYVFCLYTAMNFYHLTSFVSNKYYISIPRKIWIKRGLEKYPVVIKKWQGNYYDLGIDLIKLGRFSFRIYNIEKTICDCIRYRKELGLNTLKEVLNNYFRSRKKNMSKLTLYAETLGVGKKLKEYAGLLL